MPFTAEIWRRRLVHAAMVALHDPAFLQHRLAKVKSDGLALAADGFGQDAARTPVPVFIVDVRFHL